MSQLGQTLLQAIRIRSAAGSSEEKFRRLAWSTHEKMGWPTRKTETWRYSTCEPLMEIPFRVEPKVSLLSPTELAKVDVWSKQFEVVVLKNGIFISGKGASSLSWDLAKSLKPRWEDGFAPAMAAAAQGGVHIEVSERSSQMRPLLVAHFFDDRIAARSSLNVINVKDEKSATVVEVWDSEGQGMNSTQTFVDVAPGSKLTYARLVQPQASMKQFADTQVHLAANAELNYLNVHLGADWSRSSLTTTLAGEGASAQLSGISFGANQQHSDQRVEVRHTAPHTTSRQLFKGVWRDRSHGVINGKIYIAPGVQKVDSAQLNHNLLMSPLAQVDTKPELEVYADDVKANHGASLGRMDDEKLFYFVSRGISRPEAEQLLSEGFVKDAVLKLGKPELQDWLLGEIKKAGGPK
jgi:Fe-S cluster assembly protein SufD